MNKRRSKGNGSIRERPQGSGRWQIRYDGPPDFNGKPAKLSVTFKGTRREAERKLRECLGAVEDGSFVAKHNETVADLMNTWLGTYAATNTRPSTLQGYRAKVRVYIIPSIGAMPLQNLQAAHIDKIYAEMLERGLSAKTARDTHMILRKALSQAVTWGMLGRNPADAATPPKPEKKEMAMWDVPTIHAFLEAAKHCPYGDLYHLAILTGMRRGELVGLRWEYVNLDESWLSVASTLQRLTGRGVVTGNPKTNRSRRTIALSKDAVGLLKAY